jgi:hypothetical protein
MEQTELTFQETNLWDTPIRDLGLTIEGTRLEPIIADFLRELDGRGIRLRPRFYLSSEWGVPFETISIAIPFYLADPELLRLHRDRVGIIEGLDREDVLRYLRHEMGHVMNYAYRLFDTEEWIKNFGAITQPYEDDYTPQPFSRRHVRHLPGWYAQKHPDEDWSETFAVWLTPGLDWYGEYRAWPVALAKLKYCDRIIARVRDTAPIVTDDALDEDVAEIAYTLEEFYDDAEDLRDELPPGIDGALRAIFRDLSRRDPGASPSFRPAAALLQRLERDLMGSVFRWTGHFPERTSLLVRHLGERASLLGLGYDAAREEQARVAVTTFITALAMNFIHRGAYLP